MASCERHVLVWAALTCALGVAHATPAHAAVPKLEDATKLLRAARLQRPHDAPLRVALTRVGDTTTRHVAAKVMLRRAPEKKKRRRRRRRAKQQAPRVCAPSLSLTHKQHTRTLSATAADLTDRLAWIALCASDPITAVAKLGKGLDSSAAAIDVRHGAFLVRYGAPATHVELSHRLDRLVSFTVTTKPGERWRVVLRGTLPDTRLPASILITRNGATRATVQLAVVPRKAPASGKKGARSGDGKKTKSKKSGK